MYTLTYIYTSTLYIPNQKQSVLLSYVLMLNVIECKTLGSIYSMTLVFHNGCFE